MTMTIKICHKDLATISVKTRALHTKLFQPIYSCIGDVTTKDKINCSVLKRDNLLAGMNFSRKQLNAFLKKVNGNSPLAALVNLPVQYYISYVEGDRLTYDHELCHYIYWMYPEYKKLVHELWKSLPKDLKKIILDELRNEIAIIDEWQAYTVTEPISLIKKYFKDKEHVYIIKECKSILAEEINKLL